MKLREETVSYKVLEANKVVIAEAEYRAYDTIGMPLHYFHTKGIAQAKHESFDENVGKRLARARAEKEAYIQYRDFLKMKIHEHDNEINELSNALNKALTHIENQKNYVKTF